MMAPGRAAGYGLVRHGETGHLRVRGQVPVDEIQGDGVVIEIEAQLGAHGGHFSGPLAEHRDELLGGQWLDAAVLPPNICSTKLSFASSWFLQVGDRLLARARLDELVEQPFALDPSFMPADDDAGCTRIGACLTAVAHHGSAQLVVGVLQIVDDDHGDIGEQGRADALSNAYWSQPVASRSMRSASGRSCSARRRRSRPVRLLRYASPPNTMMNGACELVLFAMVSIFPYSRTRAVMRSRHRCGREWLPP